MKLWNLVNLISGLGAAVLVVAILFGPLPILASYGMPLLVILIALGVLNLAHSAYVFVKETPQRRWGERKVDEEPGFLRLKWKTWKSIGEWLFLAILFVIVWQFQKGSLGSKECPDLVRGNVLGNITLQFFYSPFCLACWKGEAIVENLVRKYQNVRFEDFDVRYCREAVVAAGIRSTTAYRILSANASEIVYTVNAERIERKLCSLGGCL